MGNYINKVTHLTILYCLGLSPAGLLVSSDILILVRWLEGWYTKQKFNVTNFVQVLSCLEVIVKESEKYTDEWELQQPCTPDVPVSDVAEALQGLQIVPSSRDPWIQLKVVQDDLMRRVQSLEESFLH